MRLSNPYSVSVTNPLTILSAMGFIAFWLIFGLVINPILHRIDNEAEWFCAMFVVVTLMSGVAVLMRYGSRRVGRWLADRCVRRLVARLEGEASETPSFILYLRPHWLDGNDNLINPYFSRNWMWVTFYLHNYRISFDHLLSLELDIAVVALGTSEMRISTGSIKVSNDDWKKLAAKLIGRATTILLVPGDTEGLLWEIGEIERQGRAPSVVLMQPPEFCTHWSGKHRTVSKEVDKTNTKSVRDFWDRISGTLASSHGIRLRPYEKAGTTAPLASCCNPHATGYMKRLNAAFAKYPR